MNTVQLSGTVAGEFQPLATVLFDADSRSLRYQPADGVPLLVLQWAKWCLSHGATHGAIRFGGIDYRYRTDQPLPVASSPPPASVPEVIRPPAPTAPPPVAPPPVPTPPPEPERTGPREWQVTGKTTGGQALSVIVTAQCREDAEEAIKMTGAKGVQAVAV